LIIKLNLIFVKFKRILRTFFSLSKKEINFFREYFWKESFCECNFHRRFVGNCFHSSISFFWLLLFLFQQLFKDISGQSIESLAYRCKWNTQKSKQKIHFFVCLYFSLFFILFSYWVFLLLWLFEGFEYNSVFSVESIYPYIRS